MKIKLENKFHGTEAVVICESTYKHGVVEMGDHYVAGNQHFVLSQPQTKRATKKLCGMSDCSCGLPTVFGGVVEEHNTRWGTTWSVGLGDIASDE